MNFTLNLSDKQTQLQHNVDVDKFSIDVEITFFYVFLFFPRFFTFFNVLTVWSLKRKLTTFDNVLCFVF